MAYDPTDDDLDLPPEHDPVVRLPKRMATLPEPPQGPGIRTVLLVALGGALLGASLGAVGIGIVFATQRPLPPATARHTPHREPPGPSVDPAATNLAVAPDAGAPSPPPQASRYESRQLALGRGNTLATALRRLGLIREEPLRVTRALRVYVNMRALQPTDVVCAMRDPATHVLERVEYRRSETVVWAAVHDASGQWRAEHVEVTRSTVRVVAAFRVARGSAEAMLRPTGLNAEILPRLAETFTAMGLSTRLRVGDVVRLAVDEERLNGEHYRYGRVLALDYNNGRARHRAFWVGRGRGGEYYDATGQTFERGPLHAPVVGARISSRFDPHRMHPVLHVVRPHNGCDFAAPTGTPVYAAADGTVASVGPSGPSGNLVRITHGALGVETGYAHLSRFAPGLHAGMHVRASQLVGYVGTTGRSTGPHLHFSVKRAGVFVDPQTLYNARHPIGAEARAGFETTVGLLGVDLERATIDAPATLDGNAPHDPSLSPEPPVGTDDPSGGDPATDEPMEEPSGEAREGMDEGEEAS